MPCSSRSEVPLVVVVRRVAVKGLESPTRVSNTMCARARQHRERCKEHEGGMQEREGPWTHKLPARGKGSDPREGPTIRQALVPYLRAAYSVKQRCKHPRSKGGVGRLSAAGAGQHCERATLTNCRATPSSCAWHTPQKPEKPTAVTPKSREISQKNKLGTVNFSVRRKLWNFNLVGKFVDCVG